MFCKVKMQMTHLLFWYHCASFCCLSSIISLHLSSWAFLMESIFLLIFIWVWIEFWKSFSLVSSSSDLKLLRFFKLPIKIRSIRNYECFLVLPFQQRNESCIHLNVSNYLYPFVMKWYWTSAGGGARCYPRTFPTSSRVVSESWRHYCVSVCTSSLVHLHIRQCHYQVDFWYHYLFFAS